MKAKDDSSVSRISAYSSVISRVTTAVCLPSLSVQFQPGYFSLWVSGVRIAIRRLQR